MPGRAAPSTMLYGFGHRVIVGAAEAVDAGVAMAVTHTASAHRDIL